VADAIGQADGGGDALGPELHMVPELSIDDVVVYYDADQYPDATSFLRVRECWIAADPDGAPPFEVFRRDGKIVALRVNLVGYVLVPRRMVHTLLTMPPQ
jgi:hypothetical protein